MVPPITLDSDVFKCCHEVKTLGWSDDEQAMNLLQRAADQVKPIMARRKWSVPLLIEFYPQMPNLLGMNHNHGQRIEIRLRYPSNENAFLPYESILGTLLHELVHIEVGPHNSEFYKLLDELKDECDSLIAKGACPPSKNFGDGLKDGNRLSYSRPPPKHIAKEKAVAAINKRNKIGQIMSNKGGQKLGGDQQLTQIASLCDPREMALAAAQRRLADEIWCSTIASNPIPVNDNNNNNDNGIIDVDALYSSKNSNSTDNDDTDRVVIVEENIPRPPTARRPAKRRIPSSKIPTRENPAALAAIQRAQERSKKGGRR